MNNIFTFTKIKIKAHMKKKMILYLEKNINRQGRGMIDLAVVQSYQYKRPASKKSSKKVASSLRQQSMSTTYGN